MTTPEDRIRPAELAKRPLEELVTAFGLGHTALPPGLTVSAVSSDNRSVGPGDLFVARPGERVHGVRFVADAVARGAVAVLTDPDGAAQLDPPGVPVLTTPDPRRTLGPLAAWVHGHPADRLTTFALTGTNGKTTTSYQVDHLLRALGRRTGLVGTVETRSGDRVLPSRLTTPEADGLQELFAAMVSDGVQAVTMEVSSHSIALHRVDGVVYDVAGFTNLSQDHLDFHGDLPSYFAAKAELFTPARARRGVVVVDDAWGERMAAAAQIPVETVRTAGPAVAGTTADWTVTDVVAHGTGSAFTLQHTDGRSLRTSTSLPGAFNVTNAALAVAMVLASGVDVEQVDAALAGADGLSARVPGRMEVVGPGAGDEPRVIVDFAHNTEALELALSALRPSTRGRLVVVFGATGDRDPGKRPAMGAAAVAGADVVVLTDDDPHDEDPAAVRAEVRGGAEAALVAARADGRVVDLLEVAPRAEAVRRAILECAGDDTVLVAGRGHETIQEVAGVDLTLDDRVEAAAALRARTERTTTA